jgi:hypothetical protein
MLRVSENLLAPLANNMLGLECDQDSPTYAQQIDALKEMLNVACGNLLPELAGTQAVFNLSAPQFQEESGPELPAATCAQAQLALDEGQAELTLWLIEPAGRQGAPQVQEVR